jgi:hypothetical protein
MVKTTASTLCLATMMLATLVGCQQPKTDLSEMMKPPERPAELDRLEMFVGTWKGVAEMSVPGSDEVMTSKGVETMGWDADKWLLVSHFEYGAEGESPTRGVAIWTWDPRAGKYRVWTFDNHGYCEEGSATYDEDTGIWRFKTKSRSQVTGREFSGEGKLKMADDSTMDWDWTVWDGWKLRKLFEMKGTTRRQ